MTRPKPLFKQRRPAGARLESVESVAFRKAMYAENAAEVRLRMADDHGTLDFEALREVSSYRGTIDFEGERLIVVEPTGSWPDHTRFDSAICEAGLKMFVRPAMPSDGRVPADAWVAVQELARGVRVRRPLSIVRNE
jgi:hypothetical protein